MRYCLWGTLGIVYHIEELPKVSPQATAVQVSTETAGFDGSTRDMGVKPSTFSPLPKPATDLSMTCKGSNDL